MQTWRRAMFGGGLLLSVLLGCAATPAEQKALQLKPCYLNANARELSTAALLLALENKKWAIESANLQTGIVRAKACRGTYCVLTDSSVNEAGIIEVKPAPGQTFGPQGARLVKFWMGHLEQSYNKFRCYSPDYLREEMKKRVWSLPQQTSKVTSN